MESSYTIRMELTDAQIRVVHHPVWLSPGQEAIVSRQQRDGWYRLHVVWVQRGRCSCCKRVRGMWVA